MLIKKPKTDDVLLDVRNLETHFFAEESVTRALGGISFQVKKGETLGIVGESGCGKSVTALSILRLLPKLTARTVGGEIRFHGRDLLKLSDREMRQIRGNQIAMIFQEPMTSLNPVLYDRPPDRRGGADPHKSVPLGGHGKGRRDASARPYRGSRTARQQLSP